MQPRLQSYALRHVIPYIQNVKHIQEMQRITDIRDMYVVFTNADDFVGLPMGLCGIPDERWCEERLKQKKKEIQEREEKEKEVMETDVVGGGMGGMGGMGGSPKAMKAMKAIAANGVREVD